VSWQAVSGIGPCVLAADADGRPLRPAVLYGIDTRATTEIAALRERLGEEEILDRCGSPLTSQAVGPKLLWLRHHEPAVWQQTRRMFMASSFLAHRLTGRYVLDHHSASQSAPLYDSRRQRWIPEWADEIAPGLELPELVWPTDVIGLVSAEAASLTGLPPGTPVVAGTIDAWAEAVSVGVSAPGDVMLMYGTTMFLVEVSDVRRTAPTLWGTLGVERTPLFDPSARGVLAGLTLRHARGHMYRAALEATAYGVRHNLEAMRAAGGVDKRLVAVGGGTQGGLWLQIVSDVLQQPQQVPRHTIGACYGDALLAGIGTGLVDRDAQWNPVVRVVEPKPRTTTGSTASSATSTRQPATSRTSWPTSQRNAPEVSASPGRRGTPNQAGDTTMCLTSAM
jgi:xylulokinase